MSKPLEGMTPEQFALWLNGYLAGCPEGANDAVKEQLAVVVGQVVKHRLLSPGLGFNDLRMYDNVVKKADNWPLPRPSTYDPMPDPMWTATCTTTGTTPLTTGQIAAQCDEETVVKASY